jgi:phospholipid/cholesterol/gamma-HCH transport system substrate-binding protein
MSRSLSYLRALILGGAVLAGLALAAAGLFAVGSRQWRWSDTFHVVVGFSQIRGVEPGTRVRVQGIEAGEVEMVEPPPVPGGEVTLRLRLSGKLRPLVRADASAQIISEGMLGGKVVEIHPGTASAPRIEENARLASRSGSDFADILIQVNATLESIRDGQGTVGKLVKDPEAYANLVNLLQQMNSALESIRDGQGTVGKLVKDPEAYANVVALLQQSRETMCSLQQDADALKRLPVVRSYVEDPCVLLVRPDCRRNRRSFAEAELFEPGQSVLTADGRQRLDELAPWFANLKQTGSEVVIVAYADPKSTGPGVARTLTKQQSEAVCAYLKSRLSVQKLGWFKSRKVTAVGLGTTAPPLPEQEPLPASRVEVLVFVPLT